MSAGAPFEVIFQSLYALVLRVDLRSVGTTSCAVALDPDLFSVETVRELLLGSSVLTSALRVGDLAGEVMSSAVPRVALFGAASFFSAVGLFSIAVSPFDFFREIFWSKDRDTFASSFFLDADLDACLRSAFASREDGRLLLSAARSKAFWVLFPRLESCLRSRASAQPSAEGVTVTFASSIESRFICSSSSSSGIPAAKRRAEMTCAPNDLRFL